MKKQLKISIVAFLDFLGYEDLISSLKDNVPELETELNKLSEAISEAENFITGVGFDNKFFTDNLIVTTEISQNDSGEGSLGNILGALAMYQLIITSHGYFMRGGLEVGYNYIDDKLVFGDALIEAYKLESKVAIYPRIILGNELKKLIELHKKSYPTVERMPHYDILDDGFNYIDYLKGAFNYCQEDVNSIYPLVEKHKHYIEKALKDTKHRKIRKKYIWLKDYHNEFCNSYTAFQELVIKNKGCFKCIPNNKEQ